MDTEMLNEAKDFVSGWIDKAGADGNGIDTQVRLLNPDNIWIICIDGLQRC